MTINRRGNKDQLREPSMWAKARSDSEIVVHGRNRAYPELHPAKGLDDFHRAGRKVIQHDSKEWQGRNLQPPQFTEDSHAPGYHNDLPLKGEDSWLRGAGRGGLDRPTFDHMTKSHSGDLVHNPNPRRGEKCTATGQDMEASPKSAARKTWAPPPTLNRDDWG